MTEILSAILESTRSTVKIEKDYGRDPFDQNFRKFRYKIKWNRTFLEIRFENCGQTPEVVLKFRKNGMHGKSRSI